MKLHHIVPVLLLFCVQYAAPADGHDVAREEITTFFIEKDGEGYRLYSEETVRHTYISKRSTDVNVFPIHEQYYDSVSDLDAIYRDNRLRRDNFSFRYSELEDVFSSDYRVHVIRFPSEIDTGETISYSYRRDYLSLAFLPLLIVPNIDYLKEYNVVVNHPEDVSVEFEFFFPRGAIDYKLEREDAERTILKFVNVHEREPIPYFPFNGFNAAVQMKLSRNGKALNPTTFKEFTDWYRTLFDASPMLAGSHEALLKEQVEAAPTTLEKLRAIHDYVRGTIRYIADESAMHAIVPRAPGLVLDRGYGDCKDRAHLVATIARRYGIKVNMALVSTDPEPYFTGTHVSQFNHVICVVEENGRKLFFDPTHKYCEFGNLPESDIGADALILDEQRPERYRIAPPRQNASLDLAISAGLDDPKNGRATVTLRNDYFSAAQLAHVELTGVDLENFLSNLVTSHFQKLSLDYFELESQTDSSMTFKASADVNEFIISSTTKKYLPQMPFRMIDADILKRESDTFGIYFDDRERVVMTMDLAIPGYTPTVGSYMIGDTGPARFSAGLSVKAPGSIQLRYELERGEKVIEGDQKGKYIVFCKDFLKSKKNMFVLTKE